MAFEHNNFSAGQGASDFRSDLATYRTTDAIADVVLTGYWPIIPERIVNQGFDNAPVGETLRNGDFVYVDASDAKGIFYCVWDLADASNGLGLISIGMDDVVVVP